MSEDITRALVSVIDEGLGRLPIGPTRDAVLEVRARLLAPLRVAVAGSVSSGKSTLVNALLGQQVAPVDAGECTRIVTWFRYDHHQRIEVQRRDGSLTQVPFDPGNKVPQEIGVPASDVARLIVHLSNERLRNLTIIDTPGLNTVTDENQQAAASALGLADDREGSDSRVAMADADALLFLTPHVRESDVEVLEQFRALFGASGLSAANAVGVLSKVDRLAPDGDPWPVAHRLATAARDKMAGVVSDVVPVMGLLAETAATDGFTEADGHALEAVARLDELDLEDALLSPQDFLDADIDGVDRDRRRRLLSMLDLHGIAVGVELVAGGARGASALLDGLRRRSGLEPLVTKVEADFARRAEALKARGALADVRRILLAAEGEEAVVAPALAGPLERIELDPALQVLRLLDAVRALEEGSVVVPDDLADDLRRLVMEDGVDRQLGLSPGASPAEIEATVGAAVAEWARYGNDSRRTPSERRLAEDVRELYEVLWDRTGTRPASAPAPAAAPPTPAPQPPAPQSNGAPQPETSPWTWDPVTGTWVATAGYDQANPGWAQHPEWAQQGAEGWHAQPAAQGWAPQPATGTTWPAEPGAWNTDPAAGTWSSPPVPGYDPQAPSAWPAQAEPPATPGPPAQGPVSPNPLVGPPPPRQPAGPTPAPTPAPTSPTSASPPADPAASADSPPAATPTPSAATPAPKPRPRPVDDDDSTRSTPWGRRR